MNFKVAVLLFVAVLACNSQVVAPKPDNISDAQLVSALGASVNSAQQMLRNFQLLIMNKQNAFNFLNVFFHDIAVNLIGNVAVSDDQVSAANMFGINVINFGNDLANASQLLVNLTMAGSQAPLNASYQAINNQSIYNIISNIQPQVDGVNLSFGQVFQVLPGTQTASDALYNNLSSSSVNMIVRLANNLINQLNAVHTSLSQSRSQLAAAAIRA